MNRRIFLFCVVFLLFCPQAWGADYQDTLWVRNDTANQGWNMSGIGGDPYERIDEEHEANDADYVYTNTLGHKYDCKVNDPPDTVGKTIDSVYMVGRACYAGGDDGDAKIVIVRRLWFESSWTVWDSSSTINLTDTYTNYSTKLTYDWNLWRWYVDDFNGDLWCWGVICRGVRTGIPPPNNRVSWFFTVIFSHSEEAAEASVRRLNVIKEGL